MQPVSSCRRKILPLLQQVPAPKTVTRQFDCCVIFPGVGWDMQLANQYNTNPKTPFLDWLEFRPVAFSDISDQAEDVTSPVLAAKQKNDQNNLKPYIPL